MKENKLCTHPLPCKICSFSVINLSWTPEKNLTSVRNTAWTRERTRCSQMKASWVESSWCCVCPFCWLPSEGVLDLARLCIIFHRMEQQWREVRTGHLLQAFASVREPASGIEFHSPPGFTLDYTSLNTKSLIIVKNTLIGFMVLLNSRTAPIEMSKLNWLVHPIRLYHSCWTRDIEK